MVANSSIHFAIFPFMAQGHTIPLLYLARLLSRRHLPVTVFTTTANSSSIRSILDDSTISIVELCFPSNIDGIPPGVENTSTLPSMSLFLNFVNSTKLMQPQFEKVLGNIKNVSCIISDVFLGWTQDCAEKLGIPRFGFYGMSNFATTMYTILGHQRPHALTTSLDEPFQVPGFPTLTLTRNDFDPPFNELEPEGPWFDFVMEQNIALARSAGLIVNSFYELEAAYTEYWNRFYWPKALCVGPLCLGGPQIIGQDLAEKPNWRMWLDLKLKTGGKVLYVSFGTQADLSQEQLLEIAEGLEKCDANFLWVTRSKNLAILKGFIEKVTDRGMVVGEWVDQMEILKHKSIGGFLSHCGWNSVTESICAGVPILAMPLIAEQHVNARLVVEELGLGLRIRPSNGSVRGFVKAEEVEKQVRELMEGLKGEEIKKKMEKMAEAGCSSMQEGGSSWRILDQLIQDVSNYQAF